MQVSWGPVATVRSAPKLGEDIGGGVEKSPTCGGDGQARGTATIAEASVLCEDAHGSADLQRRRGWKTGFWRERWARRLPAHQAGWRRAGFALQTSLREAFVQWEW